MPATRRHRPPLRYHALTGWYDRAAEWTAAASFIQQQVAQQAVCLGAERVLDLGCGTGNLTRALAQALPAASVTGLDPDRRSLQIAQARLLPTYTHVRLVEGSAQALPPGLGSFDLVASCLVFHHLDPEDKTQALREMHRVLRPGGHALIADFDWPASARRRLLFNAVRWLDGARNTADHANGRFPHILSASPFGEAQRLETHDVPIGTIGLWRLTRLAHAADGSGAVAGAVH